MLHIRLTNALKRPFTVFETSTQREFELRVVDAHGSEASLTERARNMRGMGTVPDVVFRNFPMTVQAGEALSADEDIAEAYILSEPGKYTVTVCRMVLELGPTLSNPVTLTVRP